MSLKKPGDRPGPASSKKGYKPGPKSKKMKYGEILNQSMEDEGGLDPSQFLSASMSISDVDTGEVLYQTEDQVEGDGSFYAYITPQDDGTGMDMGVENGWAGDDMVLGANSYFHGQQMYDHGRPPKKRRGRPHKAVTAAGENDIEVLFESPQVQFVSGGSGSRKGSIEKSISSAIRKAMRIPESAFATPEPKKRWTMKARLGVSVEKNRPHIVGHIDGQPVGTIYESRYHCSVAGVHRPPMGGISGTGQTGCLSIVASAHYEDDTDNGDTLIYTGQGGRENTVLKKKQGHEQEVAHHVRLGKFNRDQELTRGNLALKVSCDNGTPVRVVRGSQLQSKYAPPHGYRYDGLYTVERYWLARGKDGFKVYKFFLRRNKDQPPPPWEKHGYKELKDTDRRKDVEENEEIVKRELLENECGEFGDLLQFAVNAAMDDPDDDLQSARPGPKSKKRKKPKVESDSSPKKEMLGENFMTAVSEPAVGGGNDADADDDDFMPPVPCDVVITEGDGDNGDASAGADKDTAVASPE